MSQEFNTVNVMKKLFSMVDNPLQVSEFDVTDFTKEILPDPIPVHVRINFLREFREIANMVPLKVFDASDTNQAAENRQRVLDAITEAQTVADDEEAEELEE